MTNPLIYTPTTVPDDCKFKISPSAFPNFIQTPYRWYKSEILKESDFLYNTSTVIGTIVHYCAEMVTKGEMVDKAIIEEYISMLKPHDEYDPAVVRRDYPMMAECLVNYYVLEHDYLEAETQHVVELIDCYYAGGTIDRIEGTKDDCMIVDYKTYNSKTKPKAMPANYRYQLLVYAYILRGLGYEPTRIRLVYVNRNIDGGVSEKTHKPLKSYPPEVTVITETIIGDDFDFIEDLMSLCVDSIKATEKHPELTHVIWHDPRLKQE